MAQNYRNADKKGRILFIFSKGELMTMQENVPVCPPRPRAVVEPDLTLLYNYGLKTDQVKQPTGFFLDRYIC